MPKDRQNGGVNDNHARRTVALETLRKALDEALSPDFTGTVAVEVAARCGSLGGAKLTIVRWPER